MDLYFESAGVIIALILLGKYFEAVSKVVIHDGMEMVVPIEEVEVGDMLLVLYRF